MLGLAMAPALGHGCLRCELGQRIPYMSLMDDDDDDDVCKKSGIV